MRHGTGLKVVASSAFVMAGAITWLTENLFVGVVLGLAMAVVMSVAFWA